MKIRIILTTLFVAFGLAVSSAPAAVLLGGFGGVSNTALQSGSISDVAVVGSTVINGAPNDMTNGISQINTPQWGGTTLDVLAPTIGDGDDSRQAVVQDGNTNTPFTVRLTITNNHTTLDLSLAQIHFNLKKDVNNQGPNTGALTYTSGDLNDPNGTNTSFAIPNGANTPYDITLSGFLTDTTLGFGESATFTFSHGVPQAPGGNTGLRIDNFAISGEQIPEPASLMLLGLGSALMLGSRRRG